jgi:aspartate-semialdehyde dehydrogenase
MNFAIIGATGNVGRKTIEVLEKSKIKVKKLFFGSIKKKCRKKY